jgi:hypothetical protein
VLLDFLNEELPWRSSKSSKMDDVRDIKSKCLLDPERYLWKATSNIQEVKNIFYKLSETLYSDKPDYKFIRNQLNTLLLKEEGSYVPVSVEDLSSLGVIFTFYSVAQTNLTFLCL